MPSRGLLTFLAAIITEAVAASANANTNAVTGNSGITALTAVTLVAGVTRLISPVASRVESSTSNIKSAEPEPMTLRVKVAIVPDPLNEGVLEPVEVASKWYCPELKLSSSTSMG